jgi:hypothetical protein
MIEATIVSYHFADFKATLADACKKFKLDYKLEVGDKEVVGHYTDPRTPDNQFSERKAIYGFNVKVTIPAIEKFTETGFSYLGCIKDDGIVSVHPETDFDLSSLENEIKTFPCHECGKKIQRNIIHVFREDATGDIKVFGSGCAVKKFGININTLINKFTNLLGMFEGEFSEYDSYGFSKGWNPVDADFFCALTFFEIHEHGYVSGTHAYNFGGLSTAESVMDDYTRIAQSGEGYKTIYKEYEWNMENIGFDFDAFMEFAGKFIEEMEDGDFKFNMEGAFDLLSEGYVHPRVKGFVVYLVFKFWNDLKNAKKDCIEWNEDHSGFEAGQKIKGLHVEIVGEYIFEGYYGTTYIYTMRGVEDNVKYKWFASKALDNDVEWIITSCTVKKLEDDAKYGKAVVLTRCRTKEA